MICPNCGYELKINARFCENCGTAVPTEEEIGLEITEEEAKNHPRKNVLMKALGANDPIEADIFDCDMDIDGIFLCSDGATNMLETEQMEKVLYSELDIEEKIVKLIHKCNNRGGLDNISIAYMDLREGDEK